MCMPLKTKIESNIFSRAHESAMNVGLVLMAVAATAGIIEVPHSEEKRALITHQPVFAFAGNQADNSFDHSQRRERDDIGPHYVSYSAFQRTPGRTGKL